MKPQSYLRNCLVGLVLLCSLSAYASTTRLRSMGDVGLILRDDANFWLFPSTMVQYGNLAILELGGQRELIDYLPNQAGFDPSGGGLIHLGRNGGEVLGGFVGESSERLLFAPTDPITGLPLAMNRRMDLFYGMRQNQIGLGWQFTYASGSRKSSSTTGTTLFENETSVRSFGLAFGMSHPTFQGGVLDATLRYDNHSFNVSRTDAQGPKPRGGHHFDFIGRWNKGIREGVELVPFAGVALGSEGRESGVAFDRTDLAHNRILAGMGLNFHADSSSIFSLGVSLSRSYEKTTSDGGTSVTKLMQTTWRLPFVFGGVETTVFNWMKVRFGFQKALQTLSRKTKSTGISSSTESEDRRSDGPFELTFGLGVHYRNLTIDLSLDPNYFKRGVYALSGEEGNMFNLVTVTYGFE